MYRILQLYTYMHNYIPQKYILISEGLIFVPNNIQMDYYVANGLQLASIAMPQSGKFLHQLIPAAQLLAMYNQVTWTSLHLYIMKFYMYFAHIRCYESEYHKIFHGIIETGRPGQGACM